jgi:hypothetical protein
MSAFIPALPGYQIIWLDGEAGKENVRRVDAIGWKLSEPGGSAPAPLVDRYSVGLRAAIEFRNFAVK